MKDTNNGRRNQPAGRKEHMQINEIANNPYLMILSYILATIGVILAIVFYLRSKREKRPTYRVYNRTLIEGVHTELSDLKVLYKNEPQKRVTVTKLAFWNAGRETINRVDIVDTDILRIEVPADARVLDTKLLQQNEPSNKFYLGPIEKSANGLDTTKIPLSFEYVDYRNAALIRIVHTGNYETKIRVHGKIKGVEQIIGFETFDPTRTKPDSWFGKFESALSNPSLKVKREIVSLVFLVIGIPGLVLLLTGHTAWYAWALTVFGLSIALWCYFYPITQCPVDFY